MCFIRLLFIFKELKKLFKDPDFEKCLINPSRWGLFSSGAYFKNQECSDGAYFRSGAYFREGLFSREYGIDIGESNQDRKRYNH